MAACDGAQAREGLRRNPEYRAARAAHAAAPFDETGSPWKFAHTWRLRQFENTNASWLHFVTV